MPSWIAGKLVSSKPAGGGGGGGGLSGDLTMSVSGRTGATRVERRSGISLDVAAGAVAAGAEAGGVPLGADGAWAAASSGPKTVTTRASVAIPVDDAQSLAVIIAAPRGRVPRLKAFSSKCRFEPGIR